MGVDRPATTGEVLRSLVFYAAFYAGTAWYVLTSLALLPFSRSAFAHQVDGWAKYHRKCCKHILGIRLRIVGREPEGSVLVALKHESFFEAIDLPALFRRPVVFAKAELLRIPLWGTAGQKYGLVAVEREQGAKAMRAMIAAANQFKGKDRPFVIFPEGTRVPAGTEPPLLAGFAGLYKLLGLPVVPGAVDSGRLYHRRWKRAGTITVRFAEPIPPGLPRAEIEARVHEAINSLNRNPA